MESWRCLIDERGPDQTTSFCCSIWRYIGYIAVIAYPFVYNIATDMLLFSFFKLKFLVKIESNSRACSQFDILSNFNSSYTRYI